MSKQPVTKLPEYSEVTMEKFVQDPNYGKKAIGSNDKMNMRGWGLMALITFLFWLCLFVVAGFIPVWSTDYQQETLICPQVLQGKNLPEQIKTGEALPSFQAPEPLPLPAADPSPVSTVFTQSGFFFAAFFTSIGGGGGGGENLTQDTFPPHISSQELQDLQHDFDLEDSVEVEASDSNEAVHAQSAESQEDTINLMHEQASAVGELLRVLNPDAEKPKYVVGPKDLKLNWFESLQACLFQRMQLVSIQTEEKAREVEELIKENSVSPNDSDDFWTSGTNMWTDDRTRFYWVSTGEAFNFTQWHADNPSSLLGIPKQNCVELTKSLDSATRGQYLWNDYGCHAKSRFICERL